jgi:hypothetical protein
MVLAATSLMAGTAVAHSSGGGGGHGGGGGGHSAGVSHGGGGYHGGGGFRGSATVHAAPSFRGSAGFRGSTGQVAAGRASANYSSHFASPGVRATGFRGAADFRGGHGFRGGPGWRGGRWWPGLSIGFYVPFIPWYYETMWWGGVPYYYADSTYFRYDDGVGQYQVVAPPAGAEGTTDPGIATDVFVYPAKGQSTEQMARDRYECHRWAADQTGFDPTQASGGVPADEANAKSGDYQRAETACLQGRGYTVH